MSRPTPQGLLATAPSLPDLERRSRELDERARHLSSQREAFLLALAGGTPRTPEQRARWASLTTAREALELERECLDLERRRVDELTAAVRAVPTHKWARYAGWVAQRHASAAELLLEQLRRKRRALVEMQARARAWGGVACA